MNLNDDKNGYTYNKKYENNWRHYLNLYREYKYNIEDGLNQRWGGMTYLARDLGKLIIE